MTASQQPAPSNKKPRRRRKASLRARLLLLLLTPIVTLVAIELIWSAVGNPHLARMRKALPSHWPDYGFMRAGIFERDPDLAVAYRHKPGFDWSVDGRRYRINEHGMRGAATTIKKPDGVQRIAVIGDSFAFGLLVDEHESFPVQLEQRLVTAGRNVEVLNLGVATYHTGQELAAFRNVGSRFDPDIVLLVYYANDNTEFTMRYHQRLRSVFFDELPLPEWLKDLGEYSILYGYLAKARENYLNDHGHLRPGGPDNWPATERRLRELDTLCKQRKLPLVMVAVPFLKPPNFAEHERPLAISKELQWPVVDYMEVLKRYAADNGLSWGQAHANVMIENDEHINGMAYGLMADAVAAKLEELRLLR